MLPSCRVWSRSSRTSRFASLATPALSFFFFPFFLFLSVYWTLAPCHLIFSGQNACRGHEQQLCSRPRRVPACLAACLPACLLPVQGHPRSTCGAPMSCDCALRDACSTPKRFCHIASAGPPVPSRARRPGICPAADPHRARCVLRPPGARWCAACWGRRLEGVLAPAGRHRRSHGRAGGRRAHHCPRRVSPAWSSLRGSRPRHEQGSQAARPRGSPPPVGSCVWPGFVSSPSCLLRFSCPAASSPGPSWCALRGDEAPVRPGIYRLQLVA